VLEVVEPDRKTRERKLDSLLEEFNITRLRKSPSMAERLAHVVVGDEHADAAALEVHHQFLDVADRDRVDAREVVEPDRKTRERKLDSLLEEFNITRLRKSPSIALSGVVVGDEHADAAALEVHHQFLDVADRDRVDAREGLVLDSLLEEFNITRLRKSPSIALSGGERRRCEIARVMSTPMPRPLRCITSSWMSPTAIGSMPAKGSSSRDNIRAVLEVVEPDRKTRERKLDSLLEEFNITRLRP
jgi:ABC-type lipopolysaccharide export system ATPase subunit